MRDVLEAIITHPRHVDPATLQEVLRYTKLFWINSGPYVSLSGRKFVLKCTPEAFKAAVKLRPEILECHEVAGGFDYLLKTRVAHMGAYRDLVAAVAWSLPGVRDVRTYAVMEELKNTAALPF